MEPLELMPDLPDGARVVVVGGANTDVIAMSTGPLRARDSNPGTVRTRSGGVGRNIAEVLAGLGAETHLITAFGDDDAARSLAAACAQTGIRTHRSITVADLPGARYVAILDETHDMSVAVSDMRVLDALTPDLLGSRECAELIAGADMVIADANLPVDSLEWLAEARRAPLLVEPVSTTKASRLLGILSRSTAITPNTLEAGVLLGREVRGYTDADSAARELVALGAASAFVTCGAEGVAWADAMSSGRLPAPDVRVASANGAGDAFAAGVAYALLAGAGTATGARIGSAIAALVLEGGDDRAPITRESVRERLRMEL
ncbi:MAG: carbohydrate kinase family protein [Coriobacteriia bacterium]|nr:carbohydrate kinase family protein [Coriobacteriia bacterium]